MTKIYSGLKPIIGGSNESGLTDDERDKLNNAIDKTTFNSHKDDKNNPHEVSLNKLTDTNLVSLLDGQTLVYNSITNMWENKSIQITSDGKIKLTSTGTLDYLNNLIGNSLEIKNDKLVVKSIDGLDTTIAELNFIHGLDKSLMSYLSAISNSMQFKGVVADDTALNNIVGATNGDTYIVQNSVSNNNKTMTFIYNGTQFESIAETSIQVRDFTINPIDLTSEVTGILNIDKVDTTTLAKKTDLENYLDKVTYDTNNNGIVDKAETLEGLTKTVSELNESLTTSMVIEGDNITITRNEDGSITISSNSSGGHKILKSDNMTMEQKEKLKFSSDFEITNDDTNNSTDIKIADSYKDDILNTISSDYYTKSEIDSKISTTTFEDFDYTEAEITANLANVWGGV